ncbi:MAG: SRPBCC family protein [Polyangiaceae bacterium]
MPKTSVVHATFVLERIYPASPDRVFAAWAEPSAKARWFSGSGEMRSTVSEFDFRVGGWERVRSGAPGGAVHAFDSVYQDIVPNQRIVYSYDMHIADARISVSLATVEFEPSGSGTRLVFTEQAAFLDGYDDAGSRERSTRALLDKLERALREA